MVHQKSLSICKNSHNSRKLLETHESHNWADRSQRCIQRALQVAQSPSGRECIWVLKTQQGKCSKVSVSHWWRVCAEALERVSTG